MKIYVASSWRNQYQPRVVSLLLSLGHEVYDFRHPEPGCDGFSWSVIDPDWCSWTPDEYRRALSHPVARAGYALDVGAVRGCDAGLLVLPAGQSASWELGHIMGQGKPGFVYVPEPVEPDLMFAEATILVSEDELRSRFEELGRSQRERSKLLHFCVVTTEAVCGYSLEEEGRFERETTGTFADVTCEQCHEWIYGSYLVPFNYEKPRSWSAKSEAEVLAKRTK